MNRGTETVWLLIPLIYFLGWWQTGSLRQAFNGTVAWIVGYALAAALILFLDVGGFSGIAATPDSPGAGLAILGGFIGMWTSNILWRRRGGDPPRKYGKWERSVRAMMGMDKKKKKKKKSAKQPSLRQPAPQQQMPPPPPPPQQPVAATAPMDAQYRPAQGSAPQPPAQGPAPQPASGQQFQQSPAGPPQNGQYPPQSQQAAQPAQGKTKQQKRNSPTADKYAKATGRALGAMFRSPDKKKSKN